MIHINQIETLADLACYISQHSKNKKFLNCIKRGKWVDVSAKKFSLKSYYLATNLLKLGVKKGDKIAIFSDSSPYWLICDMACQLIGAVTVPMFTNISKENLKYQLDDSGAKYAFIIGSDKWQAVKKYAGNFKWIFTHELKVRRENTKDLSDLLDPIENLEINYKKFTKQVKANDLATIIYTSGSTGNPKGVCLSHKNLISQIMATRRSFHFHRDDVVLSYLPLAHIFERMVTYAYLSKNLEIYFADDVQNIPNLLVEIRPTIMTTVPRLLEKIHAKIQLKLSDASMIKKNIAKLALFYAGRANPERKQKTILKKLFDKLVYHKLLAIFGGRLKFLISGGAPLDPDLAKLFMNFGVVIREGYGLTESSPVIAVNTEKYHKFASVGKAFPGVKIKIAENSEILAKGPNIMQGYYNNDAKTKEVIANGWLKTGDMGYLDEAGYLFITGRIKELQKTSNGKYVPTLRLEAELKKANFIDNAVIIAEGRKFVSAVIFPDFALVKAKKLKVAELKEVIQKQIDLINKKLNHWEQIQKFIIAKEEPSIENEQLTPSMKLRKHIIANHYNKEVEQLY